MVDLFWAVIVDCCCCSLWDSTSRIVNPIVVVVILSMSLVVQLYGFCDCSGLCHREFSFLFELLLVLVIG